MNVLLKNILKCSYLFLKSFNLYLVLKSYFHIFPHQLLFECPPKQYLSNIFFFPYHILLWFRTYTNCLFWYQSRISCIKKKLSQTLITARVTLVWILHINIHFLKLCLSSSVVDSAETCLRNWVFFLYFSRIVKAL